MDAVAFIPARGGSKRAPNKNLAMFRGLPLAAHAVRQAFESNRFARVLVSTDDETIKQAVSDWPVEILDRPLNLAGDKALLIDVIRESARAEELDPTAPLALLLATAPLRTGDDIRTAMDIFLESDQKAAVVSVTEDENPIHLAWNLEEGTLNPVFPKEYIQRLSKKDRLRTYHFNDALVIDSVARWLEPDRNLFGDAPRPYLMPLERSLCIDYEFQLRFLRGLETD